MKRIFALQLKNLGELLLTTPALAALKQNDPEAHVTLAVDSTCRELLPALDFIDESIVFSRKDGNRAFWRKLIFASFDICLDFTGNDRSAICSILSKSHQRITFEQAGKSQLRPIFYNTFVDSPARECHVVDHYLHLLRPLKIAAPREPAVSLNLPEWAGKKAQQLLGEMKLNEPYVLLYPGAARPEKYWLADRWAEVVDYCATELKLPCIVAGTGDAYESEHIAGIKPKAGFHDLTGRADLLSLAALIRDARFLFSVDSTAMHLGAAFGTRQIALFGKTNPFHCRPRHGKAAVLQAGHSSASSEFTPQFQTASMNEISTQQVIDAIRAAI